MYSMDLKVRIFEACQAGESHCQAARRFSVSQGFVSKMMKRFRETGSLVVLEKEKRGPKFRFTRKQEEKLGKLVSENPGMNASQLRDKLRVEASPLTVWRALRRLGFTVKKTVMPAEQKRPDVVEARKTWRRRVARKKLGQLIVLHETAFTTNRHTACGYAPKGESLTVFEPHGQRNTTSFVGPSITRGRDSPSGDRWP